MTFLLDWRVSRHDDQVFREQKRKNHDRCKKEDPFVEDVDWHSYHDEKFTVTGILDDIVLVTSCADVDIGLKYLTISVVVTVSVSSVASRILPRDVGISSDASFSTDDTYYIS